MIKKYISFALIILVLVSCENKQSNNSNDSIETTSGKDNSRFFQKTDPVTLGCYYYPEQWSETEWDRDLKKMSELGFEFTHFGEFAWSMMEPTEGKYDFSWLDRAIETAAKYKLKVILCTPSPTPPAWLTQKYPEILMENEQGILMQHGSRQHGSWSSKIYREYIGKIVTQLGKRYGNDPRIWGWQLDNEPSHYGLYDYNKVTQQAFREWLQQKYTHVDSLNNRWGNNFWSQRYNSFDQIRIPNSKELVQPANPHALLDFQEFSNGERGIFLREQVKTLQKYCSSEQFITTNYFMQFPHIDPWVNQSDLDFASYTNYPVNSYSTVEDGLLGFRLGSGRDLAMTHDFYQSVNGLTGIMELQPGQVNWGRYNTQPLPGAVRMWIWHTFGLGAKFVCTYRYRQPLYGNEQYHQGIIQTDGISLSRGGAEYAQAIKELAEIKKQYIQDTTIQKIGIWWDHRSTMDLLNFPHNQHWNAVNNVYRHYQAIKSFAVPVDFLTNASTPDPSKYPVILVPSVQLINDEMLQRWEKYVKTGGTLIMTARTGQKNRDGHLWKTKLQEKISGLTGASVLYYDHLPPHKMSLVTKTEKYYEWNSWGEVLKPLNDATTTLAQYSGEFYSGKAAVVSNTLGKGKVIYIGVTTKDGKLEKEIIQAALSDANITFTELPEFVYQEKRGNLTVAVNYSSIPYDLKISDSTTILLGEKNLKPGSVTVWKK